MPVPRRRHGRSRQGKRRANWKLTKGATVPCENCGVAKRPHHICLACGTYRKKDVIKAEQE